MKCNLKYWLLFLAVSVSSVFAGENAAPTWGDSMGYSSVAERSLQYSQAYNNFLMRRGQLQGVTNYTDNRTVYDNSVTDCRVAGSCQSGGSATNINGYVAVDAAGNNNNLAVDIDTQGTTQNASSTPVSIPEQNAPTTFEIGFQN